MTNIEFIHGCLIFPRHYVQFVEFLRNHKQSGSHETALCSGEKLNAHILGAESEQLSFINNLFTLLSSFWLLLVPTEAPKNFRLNGQTLTSTSVEFLWQPVDMSPQKVLGFFVGYQVIGRVSWLLFLFCVFV